MAVAVTLATPAALVTADEDDSVAEAPEVGAEKFTVTPLTGLPPLSVTVADNALPNAMFTPVVWGVPPLAVMLAGVTLPAPA